MALCPVSAASGSSITEHPTYLCLPGMHKGPREVMSGLVGYTLLKIGSEFLTLPTAIKPEDSPDHVPLAGPWHALTQSTQAGWEL